MLLKARPEVIVLPHPVLDPHPDHVCAQQAVLEALQGLEWQPTTLLGYATHLHDNDRWPMGDAGSGFLGVTLGVFSLQAAWASPSLIWVWLILMGVFVVDATFTLIRRLMRGDKIYEAHRSHAYQYASRKFGSHLPVTLTVSLVNVVWLLPIALCVAFLDLDGVLGVIIAYIPLVMLAWMFRAGAVEKSEPEQ